MTLKESVRVYIERSTNCFDDMYVAIEAHSTADQHIALAALIGLLEMLRSEVENEEDTP